ncbi:MAG: heavy metal response regulator transcription factor, partial [Betaproteobacteria bacterium]|nr:heavy metal response regulator transcription factor [Betaproteobacteria bacterium]
MKVLIVEDDPKTAGYLRQGLTENGLAVDVAATGIDGVHLATTGRYDLLILDVMLPGQDGWSVMETIRNQGVVSPVLFLSARDGIGDRVRGLEMGADDYLVKPFAFAELLARARNILRRPTASPQPVTRVADLAIDAQRHKARRGGRPLDLTPKEFMLLDLLARRAGEVLSRTLIAESVWDMNFDFDSNVVDVHVRRLRQKVDDAFETKLIHTVRGV